MEGLEKVPAHQAQEQPHEDARHPEQVTRNAVHTEHLAPFVVPHLRRRKVSNATDRSSAEQERATLSMSRVLTPVGVPCLQHREAVFSIYEPG